MKTRITYYDILGIEPEASMGEIKKAYKIMAKADHPDINAGNKSANKRMGLLNKAYQTLIDPAARREYDKQLAENAPQGGTRSYERGQGKDEADMQKKGSWWPVIAIILIVLIVPIISRLNSGSDNSAKPIEATVTAPNSTAINNPDTTIATESGINQNIQQTTNNKSCGVNSHITNGFCFCNSGYSRNHNTGKCDKSVN